ncbi:hypothetical protein EN991_36455, partial [Mesorhizobium sp. M7A.F.Ca.US.005.03.2.1]
HALGTPGLALAGEVGQRHRQTTTRTARLPVPLTDFACKGQAWGAESMDCLRAIAEQSGTHKSRAIRMIANAAPLTGTPNIF